LTVRTPPSYPINESNPVCSGNCRIHLARRCRHRLQFRGHFPGGTVHCDMCAGRRLYCANPTPGKKNPCGPSWNSRGELSQVRAVKKGESIGYGATYTTTRATRLAIVWRSAGERLCPLRRRQQAQARPADVIARAALPPSRSRLHGLGEADVSDFPKASSNAVTTPPLIVGVSA